MQLMIHYYWNHFIATLKQNLQIHPNYLSIVHLYQTVSKETQLGQMLDLMSVPNEQIEYRNCRQLLLSKFTMKHYLQIVTYKTAIYSFLFTTSNWNVFMWC